MTLHLPPLNFDNCKFPTWESWNSHFNFGDDTSDTFFPINRPLFSMFRQLTGCLFSLLQTHINNGFLEHPLEDSGCYDFGANSGEAKAYRIFFIPFRLWLSNSAIITWLNEPSNFVSVSATEHGVSTAVDCDYDAFLYDYVKASLPNASRLKSKNYEDIHFILFMFYFHYALEILYTGHGFQDWARPSK